MMITFSPCVKRRRTSRGSAGSNWVYYGTHQDSITLITEVILIARAVDGSFGYTNSDAERVTAIGFLVNDKQDSEAADF